MGQAFLSDGAASASPLPACGLVLANPAGLFRVQMMQAFAGPDVLLDLGMTATLPGAGGIAALWLAWLVLPSLASGLLLSWRKVA